MNLLQLLNPGNLPEKAARKGVLNIQREIVLQHVMNILLVICSLGFAMILMFSPQVTHSSQVWIYLLAYLGIATVTLVRNFPYAFRAAVAIAILGGLAAIALVGSGLGGAGMVLLLAAILLTNLFFSSRVGAVVIILSVALLVAIGLMMNSGRIPLPQVQALANSGSLVEWGIAVVVLIIAASITASSLQTILRGLNTALIQNQKQAKELGAEQATLEERVQQRSADLRKRVEQFEVASQIAREISGETDLEDLLTKAVNLIHDRFGFYHVGLFVNDDKNQYTILRAATGDAGRAMLDRSHRLKIGEIGMVGYAASSGESRIAMDVTGDALHYKNPLLPETRSEVALPLRASGQTIGALDVQSVIENAFSQEDVRILQTIADQLALAFEKTRLVTDLRHSLEEIEGSAKASSQKAWRTHLLNTRQQVAYRYHDNFLDTQVEETPQARQALATGQPLLQTTSVDARGKPYTIYAVPIRIRNVVLGVVNIRFESGNVSPDLLALIEGTVNRLSVSLENARLLEEIQLRAERDRLVSDISSKVRSAPDVDSVLRIAIQEIGQSLGVSEVMVQLRKDA